MVEKTTCTIYREHTVFSCTCKKKYVLFAVSAIDGDLMSECERATFCPFCGKDNRTEEEKRWIQIQKTSTFTCPDCNALNKVSYGRHSLTCSRCGWYSHAYGRLVDKVNDDMEALVVETDEEREITT